MKNISQKSAAMNTKRRGEEQQKREGKKLNVYRNAK